MVVLSVVSRTCFRRLTTGVPALHLVDRFYHLSNKNFIACRSRRPSRQEVRCRFWPLPNDYLVSTSQSGVEIGETNLREQSSLRKGVFMNEFLLLAVIMIYVAILY
jgi:hypothetical protein